MWHQNLSLGRYGDRIVVVSVEGENLLFSIDIWPAQNSDRNLYTDVCEYTLKPLFCVLHFVCLHLINSKIIASSYLSFLGA